MAGPMYPLSWDFNPYSMDHHLDDLYLTPSLPLSLGFYAQSDYQQQQQFQLQQQQLQLQLQQQQQQQQQQQHPIQKRAYLDTQYSQQSFRAAPINDQPDFYPEDITALLSFIQADAAVFQSSSESSSSVASPLPVASYSPAPLEIDTSKEAIPVTSKLSMTVALATAFVSAPATASNAAETGNVTGPGRRNRRKRSESVPVPSPKRKRSASVSKATSNTAPTTSNTAATTTPSTTGAVVKSKRARALELMMKRDLHNDSERQRRGEMKDGFLSLRSALPAAACADRMNTGQLLQFTIAHIRELEDEDLRLQAELDALKKTLGANTSTTMLGSLETACN